MTERHSPGDAHTAASAASVATRATTCSDVRDIALAGHAGSGKTSLAEAFLYVAGHTDRQGKVDEGNTLLDYDPEETRRRASIQLSLAACKWDGRRMTWVDTPGAPDFAGDFAAALRVVDDVLLVTTPMSSSSADIEFGLESAWEQALTAGKAEAIFINKMDRENADFYRTVDALRERIGRHVVPAVLPIGAGPSFIGVVDLVTMTAWIGAGREAKKVDIPKDLMDKAREWRQILVEVAAEGDDELIEEFLEGKELTEEEIERGIHEDLLGGKIIPVFCGSATQCIGIQPLLTHLAMEFESPDEAPAAVGADPASGKDVKRPCDPNAPFSALVFKTVADPYVGKLTYFRVLSGTLRPDSHVWNATREKDERVGPLFLLRGKQQEPLMEVKAGEIGAVAKLSVTGTGDTLCERSAPILYPPIAFPEPRFAVAAFAKTKTDEDKLGAALARVAEEDPTFQHRRDETTGETLLAGLGETHVDVVVNRLARFGAKVDTAAPRIPYRETITGTARAQGRHKKQTGGRGQFGDCWLSVEPLPRGGDFEFVDKIVGGAIPRQYIPAVEKGVREAMARGIVAGYPVVDVRVTVDDGSFHAVDSSEAAFHMAGILGFNAAARQAGLALQEPIMDVSITLPDAYLGDVVGDLSSRRGHVVGIEPADRQGCQTIRAHVPAAAMQRYAVELRALSQGRGTFCASLAHYAEVPQHQAEPLIAEFEKRRAEGSGSHG
jgi:elongation factor G